MPLVLRELKAMAAHLLKGEREPHTLQPTALVNELYLRLAGRRTVTWRNRRHFFGFAVQTMRRILVDHARRHQSRGRAGAGVLPLEQLAGLHLPGDPDLVALDEALTALATLNPRQARIVELRFFLGLSLEEVAELLRVSLATVNREWASARAWLFRELRRQR